MSYPQPNAPPPGLNPGFAPAEPPYPLGPGYSPAAVYPSQAPGYPPHAGDGFGPNPGYPAPTGEGFVPAGGYPAGYPTPSGYAPPQQMDSYPPGGGYPQPMTSQPVAGGGYPAPGQGGDGNWMPIPTGIPVCPPGLEYLTMIDQLLVHQKVELLEAFLSFETKNKYTIKNSVGQKIYTAKEDTDCCTRNCCGSQRPFDMKIKDNGGNEIIHLVRDLRCDSCLCPCCLQTIEVMSPPGVPIGRVVQEWSILTPQFRVESETGETVLKISGPFCTFSICGDVEFEDYMFFEKKGNEESDRPGML
ncbi:hypothetical protein JTE90_001573 [Oedothorax gibbosus]|uniref:Phospholipid scramblase n=1 Tax=Oedothorax gibbosus TaxID=931172 RepID=A0AAV6VPL2_9ARAC|nr:hypothetical protein JTE90_001573 [Oedothorax gibbosus]